VLPEEIDVTEETVMHVRTMVATLVLALAILAPQAALAYRDFHPQDPRTGQSAYLNSPYYRWRHANDGAQYYGGRSAQRGGSYGGYYGGGSYVYGGGDGFDPGPSMRENRRREWIELLRSIATDESLPPEVRAKAKQGLLRLIDLGP